MAAGTEGVSDEGADPAEPSVGAFDLDHWSVEVERDRVTEMRLSFSLLDGERIDEGIGRLAAALRAAHRNAGRLVTVEMR